MVLPVYSDFSMPKKRSVNVAGHRTSFTLEDSFWALLKNYAQDNAVSVASVVYELDKMREHYQGIGLSCMIRQFLVNDILNKIDLGKI